MGAAFPFTKVLVPFGAYKKNILRISEFLNATDPHIVALQEVDEDLSLE